MYQKNPPPRHGFIVGEGTFAVPRRGLLRGGPDYAQPQWFKMIPKVKIVPYIPKQVVPAYLPIGGGTSRSSDG
jgi:hypothetical protein